MKPMAHATMAKPRALAHATKPLANSDPRELTPKPGVESLERKVLLWQRNAPLLPILCVSRFSFNANSQVTQMLQKDTNLRENRIEPTCRKCSGVRYAALDRYTA